MKRDPYLSIVVVGRNDDYGIGFLERFQIFSDNQFFLWNRFGLEAELVVVEWNPPAGKPYINDVMRWPKTFKTGSIRIIRVPPEVHRKLPNSERQQFFEYIGKNVGVRRARGQYVLCSNPDLLYSEELVRFFASHSLHENEFYRVDRCDMPQRSISPGVSPDEQLRIADKSYRYIHNNYGAMFIRGENLLGPRNMRRVLTYLKNKIEFSPFPPPYMNAAGDFFLMQRDKWHFFGGYPELDHYAYPDALVFMALSSGLRQVALKYPLVIYHQDHERGGADTGRPLSDFERNRAFYVAMLKKRKPWLPNRRNWGFGDIKLPEVRIC